MTSLNPSFEPAGTHTPRLIALELNELCPALLQRWMAEGLLPNFKRLHDQSDVFVTRADVEDSALMEPWIQWYSIHTGLSYDQHRVFHLTEGARAGHPDIYRMLTAAGRRVASFASMNVAPFADDGSVFVGDPWSENGDAHPPALNVYNRFVSHNVREYSNAAGGMGAADYARFLGFMASHGLSGETVATIVEQLASEKLSSRELSWRRVAILDQLQFDVFRAYYRRTRPQFASFFANSVAHLQHSYWRHMDPGAFTIRPDAAEMAAYGDAIRTGYMAMDKIVGRFLSLARREGATLMFLTALSQQPFLRHEEMGGQHFHRLHDVAKFLKHLGIAYRDVAPTMTHQYLMQCGSDAAAHAARARLEALRLDDGRTLFGFPEIASEPGSLYFGCQISTRTSADTPVIDGQANAPLRFGDWFYQIEAIKSGRHHPDGCLWIQTGRHRRHGHKPSILDVLPTQLEMLGVPLPLGAFQGKSLAPALAA
jgi:hypothetical protein